MAAAAAAAQSKTAEPVVKELSKAELEAKFESLKPLFYRPAGMAPPIFEPGWGVLNTIAKDTRVLVVGAGGLGCELLKDLALSGFQDITVIDMDTIDVTNLNRQFLFRKKDVGGYKAQVAAEFIMRRCEGVKVQFRTKRLQEFGPKFYQSFHIVIAGLDNVQARSWLNNQLCDLVRYDESGDVDWDTVIPMIDGGTTGFMGQTRLFIPRVTSCFECQTHTLQAGDHVHAHLCTIADVPRIPEHCVQYAMILLWPRLAEFTSPDKYKMAEKPKDYDEKKEGKEWEPPSAIKLDKDNPAHMTWIFRRAEERANQFKIKGVTYSLTQQVVKNIIPAIASTNALISAACVTEALKYRTFSSWRLNNYMMYMGDVATNSETFVHARLPECPSCSKPLLVTVDPATATVADLVKAVAAEKKRENPTIITPDARPIYNGKKNLSADKAAAEALNLPKKLKADCQLQHNDQVIVYAQDMADLKVIIRYTGEFPEPPQEDG